MTRDALYLVTLPVRILAFMVRETLDSGAVVLGMKWRDPYGRTHWRRAKPRIPVARVVR
ncbi:MAG TPA: hypothetical protein VIV58_21965 [Kofleriaceae bacterium]